jgi:hypothetical protein
MNKLVAMLTLLLLGVAFAESGPLSTLPSVPIAAYLPVSLVAFTISLDVVAIGYIISKLFPSAGISGWINAEYWELAKTAMLIAGIYAILVFISSVAVIVSGGTPSTSNVLANFNSIITSSNEYFAQTEDAIGFSMDTMYYISQTAGALRSITLSVQPFLNVPPVPESPVYFKWGYSESIYANQLLEQGTTTGTYESMINDAFVLLYIPMAFLTYILHIGIYYAIVLGLWILLPIGILFRAFPFIRGIGGTLIGIGMGIGIIFPATIVMFNIPLSNAMQFLMPQSIGVQASNFLNLGGFGLFLTGLTNLWYIIGSIYYFLNLFWSYGAYLILLLLTYILDLAIVYALADNIARTFGGSFRLGLTGKMRLV